MVRALEIISEASRRLSVEELLRHYEIDRAVVPAAGNVSAASTMQQMKP